MLKVNNFIVAPVGSSMTDISSQSKHLYWPVWLQSKIGCRTILAIWPDSRSQTMPPLLGSVGVFVSSSSTGCVELSSYRPNSTFNFLRRLCEAMSGFAKLLSPEGKCGMATTACSPWWMSIFNVDKNIGDQIFRLKTLRLKTFRLKKNSRKSLGNANFRPAKRVRPAQRLEKPHLKVRLG